MIQYKVSGNIVKYKNADNIDIHSWKEIFTDDNPLIARQNAINFYSNILAEIDEAGEKIEDKITTGGDAFDDTGLGIGVYLEITHPFEKLWDKVAIPHSPNCGLGSDLEGMIKELVDNGDIEDESDFQYWEDDFQFIILGVGKGIFATPPWFIRGLENEIKIYNFFDYDKNRLETTVSCFDHNKKKLIEHIILKIPYNWDNYNQQCLYDIKTNQSEKADYELDYLQVIKNGEGHQVEFKATLFFDIEKKQKNDNLKFSISKTIAAFLNTKGGILFIGINDNGEIEGLENDYQIFNSGNKKDSFHKSLDSTIKHFLGKNCYKYIDAKFHSFNDKDFMVITVKKSLYPVILRNKNEKEFYIKAGATVEKLDIEETIEWVLGNFNNAK